MQTAGLSLDQAPPLAIPARFFLTAPLAIIAAGVSLFFIGDGPLASPWYPQIMAWTHLGTLGFLAMVMVGALYQMVPVVAGAPVPKVRLAYLVHALLLLGLIGMQFGLFSQASSTISADVAATGFGIGVHTLLTGLFLFLLPVLWTLVRAPIQDATVNGMRLALIGLAIAAVVGVLLAAGHSGRGFPTQRLDYLKIHLCLALLIWVGYLIVAVSWQVVPMFYMTPTLSKRTKKLMLLAGYVSAVALLLCLFVHWPAKHRILIAAAPAAIVVWLVQPAQTLYLLAKRNRPRADGSLLFWRTGMVVGLALLPLGLLAYFSIKPQWAMLWGWWAIWGWAGMIVHGMLTRIVPFLVWFHRMSPLVGLRPVPSMRGLLSQDQIKLGWLLHLASLLVGSAAILATNGPAPPDQPLANATPMLFTGLTGVLLMATGLMLLFSIVHVLRQQPPPEPVG